MHSAFLLFLFSLVAGLSSPCRGQSARDDTDFIFRQTNGDRYHAAFVDHDRSSPYYEGLEDFSFADSIVGGNYPGSPTKGHSLYRELPDRWLPLFCWQEQYCLSSDYPYKCLLNGQWFVTKSMEGVQVARVLEFSRIRAGLFRVEREAYGGGLDTMLIHIIDSSRQMAVFEHRLTGRPPYYRLMAGAEKAGQYPVIVNYCNYQDTMCPNFFLPVFDAAALLAGEKAP